MRVAASSTRCGCWEVLDGLRNSSVACPGISWSKPWTKEGSWTAHQSDWTKPWKPSSPFLARELAMANDSTFLEGQKDATWREHVFGFDVHYRTVRRIWVWLVWNHWVSDKLILGRSRTNPTTQAINIANKDLPGRFQILKLENRNGRIADSANPGFKTSFKM